ncbi:MAG: dCMP deaminase family protein [Deltaproteobacteria bacterium]|nr:dCMP deaminase family protein [Deltaproteobacteria bacterium]
MKRERDGGRVSWDRYFMNIAHEAKRRSTCDRKNVGAVVVRDRMILSTGYNGSIRGLPHCDEIGHMMEGGHCVATIHAEANAILQAARNGIRIDEATLYTTASPCWNCFKLCANAGITTIVYDEFYREERIFRIAKRLGLRILSLEEAEKAAKPRPGGPGRRSITEPRPSGRGSGRRPAAG